MRVITVFALLATLAACEDPAPPEMTGQDIVDACIATGCTVLNLDGHALEGYSQLAALTQVEVLMISYTNFDALRQKLLPGRTYCFVGSSGVGKSTLINRLIGAARQDTAGVSGTGEGRHTTVRRELIRLKGGALVIDNPGMREFGLVDAQEGLEDRFSEIARLAAGCRYRDCQHGGEPGCAVQVAVDAGQIDAGQLDNWRRLQQESAFYELSQVEKRHKDRAFGRFLNHVKKDLRGGRDD